MFFPPFLITLRVKDIEWVQYPSKLEILWCNPFWTARPEETGNNKVRAGARCVCSALFVLDDVMVDIVLVVC